MTEIKNNENKNEPKTISVYLNCTANFPPQEIEKHLRSQLEHDLSKKIKRYQEMKGSTVIFPDKHFSHCILEIQDAYVCGHYFSVIGGCQALIEAMMRDLTKSIGGKWKDNFLGKVDELENRMNNIPKTLFEQAKSIYGNRDDFDHLNPSVPLEHQKLEDMAREKIKLLLGCMNILYPFKTENGSLIPQSKLWHTNRPIR